MILDLDEPSQPREVGRWWMPGQWMGGGETPSWSGRHHRCHHPIRLGDRLYVSYWHGGFVILDIEDMARPRLVSGLDWSPPFITPTHTALPVPFPLQGRRVMLVADEDVAKLQPGPPSFLWLVDISDERRPVPFASFQVAGVDGQVIMVKYKDGEKKVIVGPDAVIRAYMIGSKDELKPGTTIFIAAATKKDDGSYEAATITVSRGDVKPPM